jgi:hypothetical protein
MQRAKKDNFCFVLEESSFNKDVQGRFFFFKEEPAFKIHYFN